MAPGHHLFCLIDTASAHAALGARLWGTSFVVDQLLELPDGQVRLPVGGQLELVAAAVGYASAVEHRDAAGSLRWRVLPPKGQSGAWVAVRLQDDTVTASSWSGWLVVIDAYTGAVVERHFTR